MSTELTPMQSFEQKVKERLVSDIGSLIPDEALTALIEKAMHSAFFETQKIIKKDGYRETVETKPSVFEATVRDLIQPRFDAQIKCWIDANSDKVEQAISSFLKSRAEDVFLSAIANVFSSHFDTMKWNIQAELLNRTQ